MLISATKSRLLICLLILFGLLVAAAIFLPLRLTYLPHTDQAPMGIDSTYSPNQSAIAFLTNLGYLPADNPQQSCFDVLAANAPPVPLNHGPDGKIVNIKVTQIKLFATAPLLASWLDDDPIYGAVADIQAQTADGQTAALTLTLWDYGLLTPWSVQRYGDGWKPETLCYLS